MSSRSVTSTLNCPILLAIILIRTSAPLRLMMCATHSTDIQAVADQARPVPPYNIEATTPQEAYQFDDRMLLHIYALIVAVVSPLEAAAMRDAVKPLLRCSEDDIASWRASRA
jgi:hypothetical protein